MTITRGIRIEFDTASASENLEKLERDFRKFATDLADATTLLDEARKSVKLFSEGVATLGVETKETVKHLKAMLRSLNKAPDAFAKSIDGTTRFASESTALASELDDVREMLDLVKREARATGRGMQRAATGIEKVRSASDEAGSAVDDFSSALEDSGDLTLRFGRANRTVSRGVAAAGVAIVGTAAALAALKSAVDLGKKAWESYRDSYEYFLVSSGKKGEEYWERSERQMRQIRGEMASVILGTSDMQEAFDRMNGTLEVAYEAVQALGNIFADIGPAILDTADHVIRQLNDSLQANQHEMRGMAETAVRSIGVFATRASIGINAVMNVFQSLADVVRASGEAISAGLALGIDTMRLFVTVIERDFLRIRIAIQEGIGGIFSEVNEMLQSLPSSFPFLDELRSGFASVAAANEGSLAGVQQQAADLTRQEEAIIDGMRRTSEEAASAIRGRMADARDDMQDVLDFAQGAEDALDVLNQSLAQERTREPVSLRDGRDPADAAGTGGDTSSEETEITNSLNFYIQAGLARVEAERQRGEEILAIRKTNESNALAAARQAEEAQTEVLRQEAAKRMEIQKASAEAEGQLQETRKMARQAMAADLIQSTAAGLTDVLTIQKRHADGSKKSDEEMRKERQAIALKMAGDQLVGLGTQLLASGAANLAALNLVKGGAELAGGALAMSAGKALGAKAARSAPSASAPRTSAGDAVRSTGQSDGPATKIVNNFNGLVTSPEATAREIERTQSTGARYGY